MVQFASFHRPPAHRESDVLLDVQNLSVVYDSANGAVFAVNDVSFTLRPGKILGLAGESGSGKATLAYAIARLQRPPARVTGGRVLYYPRIREGEINSVSQARDRSSARNINPDGSIDILQMSNKDLRFFRWSELAMVYQHALN